MNKNTIKKITLDSFRAFTDKKELDFEIGNKVADIVVIYAPNGTGKTSTIEGIEWATTGKVSRLDSIISKNNPKNRNPKEGNILKNRYSVKKTGSVILELDNGEFIHRETKIKNNRNHDYCSGTLKSSINGIESFDNNILSQGTISKFSYEASSGSLFQSLINNGNSEDVEVFEKIKEIRSKIDKSNSERNTEIAYIETIVSKDNKEITELENSFMESSEFYSTKEYKLFQKNFLFFQDISTKTVSESISFITEAKTIFDQLKSKLLSFDLDDYKRNAKDYFNACKVLTLESDIIKKSTELEHIELKKYNISSKKESINNFISPRSIESINGKVKKYSELNLYINECNYFVDRLLNLNKLIERKLNSFNIIDLLEKEKKLSISEGLIAALIEQADKDKITLFDEMNKIKWKITSKSSLLTSTTKESFIKQNQDEKNIIEYTKKTIDLEKLNISIKNLHSEKKKIVSFEEKLGIIKSYVSEVINERTLSSCPACGADYDDTNKLIDSVNSLKTDSSHLIDGALETLNKQKLELIAEIKNLNDIIDYQVSELKKGLNDEIRQLKEINQQANNLSSILLELKIQFDEINITDLPRIISTQKKSVESRLSLISRKKNKYEEWSRRISFKLSDKNKAITSYEVKVKNLLDNINEQFGLGINELIIKLSSYHVSLFELNCLTEKENILTSNQKAIKIELSELKEEKANLKVRSGFSKDLLMKDVIERAQEKKRVIRSNYNYIKSQIVSYRTERNLDFVDLIIGIEQKLSAFQANLLTSEKILNKKQSVNENIKNLEIKKIELIEGQSKLEKVNLALKEAMIYFSDLANNSINSEVLNDMFMYMEPHLKYDEISFRVDLNGNNKGIYIQAKSNSMNDENTPIYFLSEAQIHILSICIFLADHARIVDSAINTILIDDPVQSMDDLNSYALIDLCKIFSRRFKKQIIVTTHNRSFFNLFRSKLPEERYSTKFISL